jgi:hypothetical protein
VSTFPNPVLLADGYSPSDQQVPAFDAATSTWLPVDQGGGGGAPAAFFYRVATYNPGNSLTQMVDTRDVFYDPTSESGVAGSTRVSLVTTPFAVAPGGVVLSAGSEQVQIDRLTNPIDGLDAQAQALVTNMDGSEWMLLLAGEFPLIPAGQVDGGGALDFTAASVDSQNGADLTWTTPDVRSTAGGIFVVSFSIITEWD